MPRYWAYRHTDGSVLLRNYFHSRDPIDEAYESDFADEVLEPFVAQNRDEAMAYAKKHLKKPEIRTRASIQPEP